MNSTVVQLTRDLVRVNTVGGNESAAAAVVATRLEAAGFKVSEFPFTPGRSNLVARWRGSGANPPLTFTGHLDTVPIGESEWDGDPHGGEVADGFVHGRGSSDMKAGVAAIVIAAEQATRRPAQRGALQIILTAAEETGCEGATALVQQHALAPAGALIVAEPTRNRPLLGHKGALWLTAATSGVAAHGATPDLGENAIYKLTRAVNVLASHRIEATADSPMGLPTINVGSIEGGTAPNAVPDAAHASVDIRTTGQDHRQLLARLRELLGSHVSLKPILDLPSVATAPSDGWVRAFASLCPATGDRDGYATFFTDAAVLRPACGNPPVVICGPGDPGQAHCTDERCPVDAIDRAVEIYRMAIDDWSAKPASGGLR